MKTVIIAGVKFEAERIGPSSLRVFGEDAFEFFKDLITTHPDVSLYEDGKHGTVRVVSVYRPLPFPDGTHTVRLKLYRTYR